MGYACPVCGDPQADAEHLANHLAFTAMLGDADHESWLDDRVPDWADRDPDALAATVTDHAEETEYPQVFEDTVDRRSANSRTQSGDTTGHDHDHERSGALFDDEPEFAANARERAVRDRDVDADAAEVLEEAREMTRQMLEGGDDGEDGDEAETE